jgi:uncharacterized damage-inducible protein DinB
MPAARSSKSNGKTTGQARADARASAGAESRPMGRASDRAGVGGGAPSKKPAAPFVLTEALVAAYATNDRINRYLIENLADEVWRAEPPKGRTIAAIVAHMHNVRLMWLKSAAPGSAIPEQLDRHEVTAKQALAALEKSHSAIAAVLETALAGDGRVRSFRPDAAGFLAYLISHDAHHRGQISMLARQLGHPISQKAMFGIWEWGSR